MENQGRLKIILFLCNWGPHAAFQTLQDRGADIPADIKMVRIPCSGRISKALLFKPFEMGADGVVLAGCAEGACRYGEGYDSAQRNVADTREILDLLGLSSKRLALGHFMGEDADGLLTFLTEFVENIRMLGKSPVVHQGISEAPADPSAAIREIVAKHDVYACQDCGKCTSACSLTLSGKPFSPRAMAAALIRGELADPAIQEGVWACLTCGLCYDRCPSAVNFPEFIRDVRYALLSQGGGAQFQAHGGFFGSLARTMTSPDLPIRHWDWLPDDVTVDRESEVLFFGGCAPYFDVFFRNPMNLDTKKILVDAIRLLNFFDVNPAVLDTERCCGHDLLWTGDRENFTKLARLNTEAIHAMGIKEVVVACPEGYRTLSRDYPEAGIPVNFKVTYLLDFLEQEIDKGAVGFKKLSRTLTFQDSCRLSRHEGRADLPRKLLARLKTGGFVEMPNFGAGAICCGNSAWTGCDAFSKALQVKRLDEARKTGANLMVTACPKCQIHLTCAGRDPIEGEGLAMEMKDITSLLADTIVWD